MELQDIKGLGTPTIQKLHKAGIKTVEQLAVVNTQRKKVQGLAQERLFSLRKEAQKTIFQDAASRVQFAANVAKRAARQGAVNVEAFARKATEQAVIAAREAEIAAMEAFKHAEVAAVELAERAAKEALKARAAAAKQWTAFQKQVKARSKPEMKKYAALLKRANTAAQVAAEKAVEAAQRAKKVGTGAARQAQKKSQSLYLRLLDKMGKTNGT